MKKIVFLLSMILSSNAFANPACAVCTVAMGAFLGIARKLGVADNTAGVWIGALILMTYYFVIKFVEAKKWTFKFYKPFWGLMTLLIVPVMYKFVPYMANTFFGVDAFLVSMLAGAFTFWLSQVVYQKLKEKNGGHAHFPFEKVVFAIVSLLIVSYIFECIS